MIDLFIDTTATVIGWEVEEVTFTKYENGYWYFKGFTEYEGDKTFYDFRANICGVGINVEFLETYSYHWKACLLIIQSDIKEAAINAFE
jgi:hypothetical protein